MPAAHIVSHNPATVHPPAGGYCMGLELTQHRRLLFISGQVPERSDGAVPEGFAAQCEQGWRNVMEVLAAAGLRVEHLVKVTTFLTDRDQVATNRTIRRRMLGEHQSALTVMIAETVDKKWLLEIEAIAAA
ncbi:MAG TPA: RidA family protein [Afipia sp.]